MINIIAWIIFGLIAGAIAKFVKPGADSFGWVGTSIIGIIGSVVGGYLGQVLFGAGVTNEVFSLYSLGMSVVGAIAVLFVYNFMTRRA